MLCISSLLVIIYICFVKSFYELNIRFLGQETDIFFFSFSKNEAQPRNAPYQRASRQAGGRAKQLTQKLLA